MSPEEAFIREVAGTVYRPEGVDIWMRSPNQLLEGMSPIEMIESGRSMEVYHLIQAVAEGVIF